MKRNQKLLILAGTLVVVSAAAFAATRLAAEPETTETKTETVAVYSADAEAVTALSWPKMLEQYGMDSTVISIAGSTVAAARGHTGTEDTDYTAGGCYYPMCQRPLPDGDYDVIFVNCGANDMNCEIPLADSMSSRDIYTFQGAFNVLVDRLQEKYPNAVILAMTCWESSTDYRNSAGLNEDDYSQALMEVCEYRGIACYNASDSSFSGIHAADEAFRSSFFLTSTDGYHLNERGQALFLPRIAGWIAAQLSS